MLVSIRRHPAFFTAIMTAAIAAVFLLWQERTIIRALLVWNLAILVYLAVVWSRMLTSGVERLKRRAADLDFSDSVILILSILAALASLVGIAFEVIGSREGPMDAKIIGATFAMVTVLMAWTFLHTLFTLHYAHRFYSDDGDGGGLLFPEQEEEPGYWDFLYFGFTIGVAAQTADVSVTSTRMRRLVTLHSILSFLFNTTILALAINIGASLV
ncbi:DUF1345 domain-containing protein [Allorhizobium borbori]|uniref:Putative membrane protein n=1 Tax=Allorhizobium borbori TaxID=485907 RepID=A0A7W6NZF0_9HYPH|nr:DUF1345 domain-containing protein [Allorhizobium borbori]MBB4102154.1 putative membrane protein [Allorhizobium borbori]PZU23214.1 MAG: DUF1345 domain-containing protein [Shinella sp.]